METFGFYFHFYPDCDSGILAGLEEKPKMSVTPFSMTNKRMKPPGLHPLRYGTAIELETSTKSRNSAAAVAIELETSTKSRNSAAAEAIELETSIN